MGRSVRLRKTGRMVQISFRGSANSVLPHSAQWLWQSASVGNSVPDYKQVERVFGRDVYT